MIAGSTHRHAPKELPAGPKGRHKAQRHAQHHAERNTQSHACWLYLAFVLAALTASTVLVAIEADAQTAASTQPRYSAKDIARAFGFIDANKDGSISRTEAARFRNVAKYFDAADANKDGALSPEELSNALERSDRPYRPDSPYRPYKSDRSDGAERSERPERPELPELPAALTTRAVQPSASAGPR